jgi:phage tail sheath gpL-like
MSILNLFSTSYLLPSVAMKIDFGKAIRGLRGMPRRVLLLGHKLAAGTALTNTVVSVSTEADALALLGEGSMLLAMWRAAKANADRALPIDFVAVPPSGTAVAATTTIVLTNSGGTIQAAGEVMLYVEGKRIAVGVSTVDTVATTAAKLIAALQADNSLPVTAAATANPNEIKLTAKWGGLTGNDIDVRNVYYTDDVLPQGLTVTVPAMSAGATSPDLTAAIAALNDYRATEIACAFTDSANMALLEAELTARWKFDNMQDGSAITVKRGTEAEITTWLASRNCDQVDTIPVTKDLTSPWVTASMAGAAMETSAGIDPAQPYTDLPLVGYKGAKRGDGWTNDQANVFLLAGASPLKLQADGSATLWRVVTNYTTNTSGAADPSRRDRCWFKTESFRRWYTVTEYQLKYVGFKLAEYITEPIPGQKIMTKELVEEIQIDIYKQLQDVGLYQNLDYYKASLVIEIDGPNGKVRVQDEPVLVTQHYQTEVTSYPIAGHV